MIPQKAYIDFTKMQGAGNDFIILDNRDESISKEKIIHLAPQLCDRHFGIGADGIITLQPPEKNSVDYTMFYRNADGSDAGMCGNGARCLALFAIHSGFKPPLSFNVHDTVYQAKAAPKNQVEISFPIEPKVEEMKVGDSSVFKVHTGTEHIVVELSASEISDDEKLVERGRKLRQNEVFNPPGTNVNFIHGTSKNTLVLRTYEKGVENLTLACGTGAIAAALAWHHMQKNSLAGRQSTIIQAVGGTLQAGFNYKDEEKKFDEITLSGEAQFVYEGRYEI